MAAEHIAAGATASTRVMSCDASVVVTGGRQALAERAIVRMHDLEARWSRFLPNSEVSRLNAAEGRPCRVSHETTLLVVALVQAWHATEGAFDPTLLGSLVDRGYATSRDDASVRTSVGAHVEGCGRPDLVLVDESEAIVQLPAGTTLDPGGLGKGLAADMIVDELRELGAAGALVEIGGDLRTDGEPPSGDAWTVGIRPDTGDGDLRLVDIRTGGVATSSSRLRTWTVDGHLHHHLIDPTTGASAARGAVACTVIAGSATWAEAFSKVAFARELAAAVDIFEARGLAASITTEHGDIVTTNAWSEFAR